MTTLQEYEREIIGKFDKDFFIIPQPLLQGEARELIRQFILSALRGQRKVIEEWAIKQRDNAGDSNGRYNCADDLITFLSESNKK